MFLKQRLSTSLYWAWPHEGLLAGTRSCLKKFCTPGIKIGITYYNLNFIKLWLVWWEVVWVHSAAFLWNLLLPINTKFLCSTLFLHNYEKSQKIEINLIQILELSVAVPEWQQTNISENKIILNYVINYFIRALLTCLVFLSRKVIIYGGTLLSQNFLKMMQRSLLLFVLKKDQGDTVSTNDNVLFPSHIHVKNSVYIFS